MSAAVLHRSATSLRDPQGRPMSGPPQRRAHRSAAAAENLGRRDPATRITRRALAIIATACFLGDIGGPSSAGWQRFVKSDGLASDDVLTMLEDHSGTLWFGTGNGGLTRYDGVTWTSFFTSPDGQGADAIYEDSRGVIWAALYGDSIARYDGTGWKGFHDLWATVQDSLLFPFLRDRSGALWIPAQGGVVRWDGASRRLFTRADGLAEDHVRAIAQDSTGAIWFAFGSSAGATRWDGQTWRTYHHSDGLANDNVLCLLADRRGSVWFGTGGGGLSRFDGIHWDTFSTGNVLPNNEVNALVEDRGGLLWAGTSGGGLVRYDGRTWRTYGVGDGLAGDETVDLLVDRSGALWAANGPRGVSRFDGAEWQSFVFVAQRGGVDFTTSVTEDSTGALWFGTDSGAMRYDGSTWTRFSTADGLVDSLVTTVIRDASGALWFGTLFGGASRLDTSGWTSFPEAGGVRTLAQAPDNGMWFGTDSGVNILENGRWRSLAPPDIITSQVYAILFDREGRVWLGGPGGVTRLGPGALRQDFTSADGLASDYVNAMLEDRSGAIWIATSGGVSRYEGGRWSRFTRADGLADDQVRTVAEDHTGALWFGTESGVSRFDGVEWGTYSINDGLAFNDVLAIHEDRTGTLWFGTAGGKTRHAPDRVPPHTVISPLPPPVYSGTLQTLVFSAAFRETRDARYSVSLDGEPWSPWGTANVSVLRSLADGLHRFRVRTRDQIGNVEPTPAEVSFEVDATPPTPVITSPASGAPVRDSLVILGTAADLRFLRYRVDLRAASTAPWDTSLTTLLASSPTPVTNSALAGLDTRSLPDGAYNLRLSESDTLGLTGIALVTVVVDNLAPFVSETAPASVSAAAGGNVYTTNREFHVYFPPHAFDRDVVVQIDPAAAPDSLPGKAHRIGEAREVSWPGARLSKPATLELSLSGVVVTPGAVVAIHHRRPDGSWDRTGGTADGPRGIVSAAVQSAGSYALFAESPAPTGAGSLLALSLTPRVFSPRGAYASADVAIAFTLGGAGTVTVKIYNHAGRLVRVVADAAPFGPGANLVRWDGHDRYGVIAVDGLYLVTVEALGDTRTQTLAVVR